MSKYTCISNRRKYEWILVKENDRGVCSTPPNGSLCVVDFGQHWQAEDYYCSVDKETLSGLSCRYHVAVFSDDRYHIPLCPYSCIATDSGEEIIIDCWVARRFMVLYRSADAANREGD